MRCGWWGLLPVRAATAARRSRGASLVIVGSAAWAVAPLGRRDSTAVAGHLQKLHVVPTVEVVLTETPAHLRKRVEPHTGPALIDLAAGRPRPAQASLFKVPSVVRAHFPIVRMAGPPPIPVVEPANH